MALASSSSQMKHLRSVRLQHSKNAMRQSKRRRRIFGAGYRGVGQILRSCEFPLRGFGLITTSIYGDYPPFFKHRLFPQTTDHTQQPFSLRCLAIHIAPNLACSIHTA